MTSSQRRVRDNRRRGQAGFLSDPVALDRFYRAHVERMIRFFARRVPTADEVADLVADTFVAAVSSSANFDESLGNEIAWLYGIATRVGANAHRRVGRENAAQQRLVGRRLLDADDIGRLDERLAAEAQARQLHDALAALGDRDRALLALITIDGLSTREAAEALGMSHPAARVRLSRARSRVRTHIATVGAK